MNESHTSLTSMALFTVSSYWISSDVVDGRELCTELSSSFSGGIIAAEKDESKSIGDNHWESCNQIIYSSMTIKSLLELQEKLVRLLLRLHNTTVIFLCIPKLDDLH